MLENTKPQDLRVKKTVRALGDTMSEMLKHQNFNAITVNALCSEALISRATFYAHFSDKYALLEYLLANIKSDIIKDIHDYGELEREVNQFIRSNERFITNILKDAAAETLNLVYTLMASIVRLAIKRKTCNEASPQHVIFLNFLTGGLMKLLTWMTENKFPDNVDMVNPYLYELLESITSWDAEWEQRDG